MCEDHQDLRKKPARYRDSEFVNPSEMDTSDALESDNKPILRVKRILAKRRYGSSFQYLVQKVGEPVDCSQLPPKAQELLVSRPPPLIG